MSSSARSLQFRDRGDPAGDDKGQVSGWDVSNKDNVTNVSESTWRKRRDTTEGSCQTEDLKLKDEESQAAPIGNDKPMQTDEPVYENYDGKPYPPSLFAFFAKVTDPICEILEENQDPFLNDIFNDYNQQDEESTALENNMTKLHQLRNEKVPPETGASCIAWSKTGSQIAVGYSHANHEGWCSHQMPLSVWNINRPETINPKTPQIELEFSSCISLVSFHPQENNLLAVGLHSGEIALVDLSLSSYYTSDSDTKGDSKRKNDAITDIQGSGHAKQIICLKWIRLSQSNISDLFNANPSASTFALLSAAVDGCITLWSVSKTGSRLYLEKQFIVSSENLSEDINVGNRYKLGMKELGLTSLSTCGEDPTTFVFATHGSFVFQGFLLNDVQVSDTSVIRTEKAMEDQPLYDPITNVVAQDIGLIVALDCSPFHRNFFLYVTTEGSCFLQNLLKPMMPTLSIALDVKAVATDVQWSGRPMMFAVTDRNFLKFYDLNVFRETSKPVVELEHEENLIKIAFNRSRNDLVATSDAAGNVHIWKMQASLAEAQPNEADDLIHVGQSHIKASKIKVG